MPDYYLLNNSLIVATLLLALGIAGLVSRRNIVVVLLSAGILLQGALMAVAAFGSLNRDSGGQIPALFALTLGVLQVVLIAAFVRQFVRRESSLDISLWSRLREDGSDTGEIIATETRTNASRTMNFDRSAPVAVTGSDADA